MAPAEKLLTAEEVAEMLRIKTNTVLIWARAGKIPSVSVGRCVRFRLDEIEGWIKAGEMRIQHTGKPPQPAPREQGTLVTNVAAEQPTPSPPHLSEAEAELLRQAIPLRPVPLFDSVSAGPGAFADGSEAIGTFDVPADLRCDMFAVRVTGDSMIDAGIHDRDTIICKRLQGMPKHGSLVVAWANGVLVVKRYQSKPKPRRLRSENHASGRPDIELGEDDQIFGIALRVVRELG